MTTPVSFGDNNLPVYGKQVALAPSGVRTVSGDGGSIPMVGESTLRLTLAVTTATGTAPSLTVTVQTSHDGTTWTNVAAFTAATAAGSQRKVFAGLDRLARASWAISGTTPSFTFAVTGEAI